MTEALPEPRPADRRKVLGAQLRRLREASGLTHEDAACVLRVSPAKISRCELGFIRFRECDVRDLFVLYGGTDQEELAKLLDSARQAH